MEEKEQVSLLNLNENLCDSNQIISSVIKNCALVEPIEKVNKFSEIHNENCNNSVSNRLSAVGNLSTELYSLNHLENKLENAAVDKLEIYVQSNGNTSRYTKEKIVNETNKAFLLTEKNVVCSDSFYYASNNLKTLPSNEEIKECNQNCLNEDYLFENYNANVGNRQENFITPIDNPQEKEFPDYLDNLNPNCVVTPGMNFMQDCNEDNKKSSSANKNSIINVLKQKFTSKHSRTDKIKNKTGGNSNAIFMPKLRNNTVGSLKGSVRLKTKTQQTAARGRSRRTIFKSTPHKSLPGKATPVTSDYVFFQGSYYQIGDIVSMIDENGDVYYAQLKGFLQDEYCEKSATVTWLIPTHASPSPNEGFDPATYLLGPEEDIPRKLEYMEFVCHAPSEYFKLKNSPYPVRTFQPNNNYVWCRLGPQYFINDPS